MALPSGLGGRARYLSHVPTSETHMQPLGLSHDVASTTDGGHNPPEPNNQYEVRVWDTDRTPRGGWRTVACSAQQEDALRVAEALVCSSPSMFEYSEVWDLESWNMALAG